MADCKNCPRVDPALKKVKDSPEMNNARLMRIIKRLIAAIVCIFLVAVAGIVVNNAILTRRIQKINEENARQIQSINAYWLSYLGEYDTVSYDYQQDGSGVNIIGDQNEVDYGSAVESTGAD
jgi:hypothetical protein